MKAVGVYIYAGGFSIGVKKHFEVIAHLEDPKPYGEEVIRMNKHYFENMPIYPFPNWPNCEVDFLYANPPCAPFSNANTKSFETDSWKNDPRISCWHNTAKFAISRKIPFVAIETIPQTYSKAPSFLLEKAEEFSYEGYQTMIYLHNAMFMGSCQNRPRLFFIASKYDIKLVPFTDKPMITVAMKLQEALPYLRSEQDFEIKCRERMIEYLKAALPGERLRGTWERLNPVETRQLNSAGQIKGRPTFGVKKLELDEQMCTIVGYDIIHPSEPRFLTVKEYQVLGDYPGDYIFPKGGKSLNFVARGVSSKVGEWIGATAKETLTLKDFPEDTNTLFIMDGLQGQANVNQYKQEICPQNITLPCIGLRSRKECF